MCGIAGVVGSGVRPDDLRGAEMMVATMGHRGPDDQGSWASADGRAVFGHRRLAIIDLSPGGHQPMVKGPLSIVYNGELYNYRELRAELRTRSAEFLTESDTEVLLAAYREWGSDCVERLNGMFAFAIYDARTRRLFLARDRAGEKPLYYRHVAGRFAFASELKALLQLTEIRRHIDLKALDEYFTYGYVTGARTMFEGIHKLPAAHTLSFDVERDQADSARYWSLPAARPGGDENELVGELDRRLLESVKLRLVADVPVGVLLSGGVDSSLVTAMAARASSGAVRTFTVTFPGDRAFDESGYARQVAEHFGTQHTELVSEPPSPDLLTALARQFDEPLADSSLLPTYTVSTAIRQHATVALGGDGGDELFGGYPHYSWIQWQEPVRRMLPGSVRRMASRAAASLPLGFRGRNHVIGFGGDRLESIAHINVYFDRGSRARLLAPVCASHGLELVAEGSKRLAAPLAISALSQAMSVDFQLYLPDDLLVKVDRASMLASLEVRAPFLDSSVIEFAFASVPDRLRATRRQRKILLRRLGQRLLPAALDLDRKQGFSIPLARWLRTTSGRFFAEVLREADPEIFDRAALSGLADQHQRGRDNAQRIFAVTMFELWRRTFRATLP
ncbi:MAG: asparagine synthase (glutamine-hydrolyzing) [Gemmatimonadota bacterium]